MGIRAVRVQYPDLHGICRGKDIPTIAFPDAVEEGIPFVEAIMTVDLRHNVVGGFEKGFPDLHASPDLDTLVPLPWQPDVAICIGDLVDPKSHEPHALCSRGALKRVLAGYEELGLSPVVGPELEFYLCEPDPESPTGFRPYANQDSPVYTVGDVADPRGVLTRMLDAAVGLGLGAIAASHEYGRSQFEINLRHSAALDSADRAFRFKSLVRSSRRRRGCAPRSWASRGTTTRAPASTSTSRSRTRKATTPVPTRMTRRGSPRSAATSSRACSSTPRR
jgi:glutamine synthetase